MNKVKRVKPEALALMVQLVLPVQEKKVILVPMVLPVQKVKKVARVL